MNTILLHKNKWKYVITNYRSEFPHIRIVHRTYKRSK